MATAKLASEIHHGILFDELLKRQSTITSEIKNGAMGQIVFAELQPVITLGRKQEVSSEKQSLDPTEMLSPLKLPTLDIPRMAGAIQLNQKIPVVFGDRGGNETYHGPGQWVVFVICKLENFTGHKMGIRRAIARYLNAAAKVSNSIFAEKGDTRIAEIILEGEKIGLWTTKGKLASVGIRVRDGILQSGMSLNVYPTPTSFMGINPCGIAGSRPDFIFTSGLSDTSGDRELWMKRVQANLQAELEDVLESGVSAGSSGLS